jgi:ABC-type transport system involved in cytochrome c biogenesis ATPase subunit
VLSLLRLKFGSSVGEQALEFAPSPLVIFVGPNNSGKSLVLREVMAIVEEGEPPQNLKLVESIDTPPLSSSDAEALLAGRTDSFQTAQLRPGEIHLTSHHPITGRDYATQTSLKDALRTLGSANYLERRYGFPTIHRHYAISLDGATRLSILDPKPAYGQLSAPTHLLGRIFKDDAVRKKIREIGRRAFGLFLTVDPTSLKNLEARLSEREPSDAVEEQALDDRARKFHAAAIPVTSSSDGVRAFLGLTAAIHCSDHRLMMIDEPEAFLHPPLAREFGKDLANTASLRNSTVLASTHSASFLMGAIESGKKIDVVRLTFNGKAGTARALRSSELARLMRDPLLRSTGMLSALFHSAAVVCEGDLDRAAYAEIDRRLDEADLPSCKDSLFLSAHGKDALHRLVAPLRALGIPAAAIVDLDMVQEGLLGELLKSCGIPDGVWQAKRDVAARIASSCREADIKLKVVGVEGAPETIRPALEVLVRELRAWGIFLVPVGELEGWLSELKLSAHTKRGWLYQFFDAIGGDSSDEGYVRPSGNDVWEFLGQIAHWLCDANRQGMPA